jgi:hypothetical protein
MGIDALLSRLDRVKKSSAGRWRSRCPSHDSNGRSLSIRELDDGRVLLHCFWGCEASEVLAAIGLKVDDLFPERRGEHFSPERRPFPAYDALRAVAFEVLVVAVAGASMMAWEPFSQKDRDRLMQAVARIQAAADVAGVSYE